MIYDPFPNSTIIHQSITILLTAKDDSVAVSGAPGVPSELLFSRSWYNRFFVSFGSDSYVGPITHFQLPVNDVLSTSIARLIPPPKGRPIYSILKVDDSLESRPDPNSRGQIGTPSLERNWWISTQSPCAESSSASSLYIMCIASTRNAEQRARPSSRLLSWSTCTSSSLAELLFWFLSTIMSDIPSAPPNVEDVWVALCSRHNLTEPNILWLVLQDLYV